MVRQRSTPFTKDFTQLFICCAILQSQSLSESMAAPTWAIGTTKTMATWNGLNCAVHNDRITVPDVYNCSTAQTNFSSLCWRKHISLTLDTGMLWNTSGRCYCWRFGEDVRFACPKVVLEHGSAAVGVPERQYRPISGNRISHLPPAKAPWHYFARRAFLGMVRLIRWLRQERQWAIRNPRWSTGDVIDRSN